MQMKKQSWKNPRYYAYLWAFYRCWKLFKIWAQYYSRYAENRLFWQLGSQVEKGIEIL